MLRLIRSLGNADLLPPFFALMATLALVAALLFLWRSLRAAFGAADSFHLPSAEAESRRILEERKSALLANLGDLEFEHAGGKISDEDYEALDKKLRSEAKRVLRLLDDDVRPYRAKAEKRLKAFLAERGTPYREIADTSKLVPIDEEKGLYLAEDDATKDLSPKAKAALGKVVKDFIDDKGLINQCASCETINDADAEFCKKCGAALRSDEEAAAKDDSTGAESAEDEANLESGDADEGDVDDGATDDGDEAIDADNDADDDDAGDDAGDEEAAEERP